MMCGPLAIQDALPLVTAQVRLREFPELFSHDLARKRNLSTGSYTDASGVSPIPHCPGQFDYPFGF